MTEVTEFQHLSCIGVRPLRGCFIDIYDTGDAVITVGGKPFYLLGDNHLKSHHNTMEAKHPGIRPRWAEILAVSQKAYDEGLRVGMHVLCEQLKWTQKLWNRADTGKPMSWIDHNDIMLVDDSKTPQE